jgi:hypothetical protein
MKRTRFNLCIIRKNIFRTFTIGGAPAPIPSPKPNSLRFISTFSRARSAPSWQGIVKTEYTRYVRNNVLPPRARRLLNSDQNTLSPRNSIDRHREPAREPHPWTPFDLYSHARANIPPKTLSRPVICKILANEINRLTRSDIR